MIFYNYIIAIFLTYFLVYIIKFASKKNREGIQKTNKKLNVYRKIPIKTLNQQKEFLNIKQPFMKWKFNIKQVPKFLFDVLMYVIIINIFLYIFKIFNIAFNLLYTVLFVILFPLLINLLLQRWNLERTDLFTFFKRSKNDNNKR
jgi:hypothetical protein